MNNLTTADRLMGVRKKIACLQENHQSVRSDLEILAVSKQQPVEAIRELYEAGQLHFGENYCQEALIKQAALSDLSIVWHYIGRLQSRKIKKIATHFSWVHGVDCVAHAEALSRARPLSMPPLNICVQVNISGEDSKGGVSPEALMACLQRISTLAHVRLRGLMAMPKLVASMEQQQQTYRNMRLLYEQCRANGLLLDALSMGTSHDFELAVLAGATWVRLGEAIFGLRAGV